MQKVIELALANAQKLVGVQEEPRNSNRGTTIDLIQNLFGLRGQQYCCMTVLWCYNEACKELGIINALPLTASTQSLYEWALKHGYASSDMSQLVPGDIVIWRSFKLWKGHAGLAISVLLNDQSFRTIEGNTSDGDFGDQRNGDGIYRRIRYARKVDFAVDNFYLRGRIDVNKVFADAL